MNKDVKTVDVHPASRTRWVRGLLLAARLGLGLVFVFSGVPKLLRPEQFYLQVTGFELVNASAAAWIVYAVPVLELALAACLFSGVLLGGAWVTTVVITAGFTLLHLRVVVLGQDIVCGCFDPNGTQLIGAWTVSRNALLFAVSVVGLACYWHAQPRMLGVPDSPLDLPAVSAASPATHPVPALHET